MPARGQAAADFRTQSGAARMGQIATARLVVAWLPGGSRRSCAHAPSLVSQTQFGFTLIELMVVIALIGILSAMVVPVMKGTYDDALLRSTSRKIVDACSLAYSRAVSMNQVQRVRLDLKSERVILESRTNSVASSLVFTPAKELGASEGKLDSRVSVILRAAPEDPSRPADEQDTLSSEEENQNPDSQRSVQFYPDGTADRKVFVLRDREGFGLALRINPITARVHIVELRRE